MTRHHSFIIMGSGPGDYNAAIFAARAKKWPTLITGTPHGGQLMTTNDVCKWPANVEGAQGKVLMERFRQHAERFDSQLVYGHTCGQMSWPEAKVAQ